MTSIPPISILFPLFFNEDYCNQFLFDNGLYYNQRLCPDCNIEMVFYNSSHSFRCPKKGCNRKISMKSNSFFSRCRLKSCEVMHIGYMWLSKASNDTAIIHTGKNKETICVYYKYFRELISKNITLEDTKIGGDGVIVELDESKLGKRKYNRGHRVEGVWVFGGVERTPERRTFFVPVETRDAETLLNVIEQHVLPGSIIFTDMWRGYYRIEEELAMRHFVVNHSQNFVDPDTGVHTNTIEGTWNGLKICIVPRARVKQGIEDRLAVFQWRRIHKDDLWNSFLFALRDTHYE